MGQILQSHLDDLYQDWSVYLHDLPTIILHRVGC